MVFPQTPCPSGCSPAGSDPHTPDDRCSCSLMNTKTPNQRKYSLKGEQKRKKQHACVLFPIRLYNEAELEVSQLMMISMKAEKNCIQTQRTAFIQKVAPPSG